MSKYVFLYQGAGEATDDVMAAWMGWFESIGDSLVDGGNPFGAGRQVTKNGTKDLSGDDSPLTGYSIVNAENMDAAEKLLDGCPIIDGVRIYEAMAM